MGQNGILLPGTAFWRSLGIIGLCETDIFWNYAETLARNRYKRLNPSTDSHPTARESDNSSRVKESARSDSIG